MYQSSKRYLNHFGLDLKSDDLTRAGHYAAVMKNAQYRKSGAVEKRPGYQAHASGAGGFGKFTYNRVNPTTGLEEPIEVSYAQTPKKLLFSVLTVTYTGASASARVSIYFDTATDQYRCQVYDGITTMLDQGLGVGFDEASIYTIDSLRAAIAALSNFTATLSGATSTPAAFLKITREWELVVANGGAAFAGKAGYYSDLNTTATNPFSGAESHKNDDDFENVASIVINNVLYASNGYDEVHKFDGQTFCRAGVPTPASLTTALAAGAVTGSNYFHRIRYTQKDAVGNFIEGNILTVATGLGPAGQSMNVTLANVLAGTGFNTNCAVVNGAQSTVSTITVTSGHTMKVGDTAYFYDSISAAYVERGVTAISATTITVAGATVTVAAAAVVSNNLRVEIWRNKTSGSTPTVFYLVKEIPNNSFAATQVLNDNVADASLGAQLDEPATDRSPPPKGKYISAWNNLPVIAGNLLARNTGYWADVDGPEYWPNDGSHQADFQTPGGEIITGIAPSGSVFVILKDPGVVVISGDLATGQIRVETVTLNVGTCAFHSIKEMPGGIAFLDRKNGPQRMVGGQTPRPLGELADEMTGQVHGRIEPVFSENESLPSTQRLVLKKAVAINQVKSEKYILYIPAESATGGAKYANSFTRIFAYDYSRDAWLEWSNLNMMAGLAIIGDEFYFTERRYSSFSGAVVHVMYRQMNLDDAWDYQDNTTFIDWDYGPQWEALGEPSVNKKFPWMTIFSTDETPNNAFTVRLLTEVNYVRDVSKTDRVVALTGEGYGVAGYGSAYGDPLQPDTDINLSNGHFKSICPRFQNQEEQQNVIINGWEMGFVAPYRAKKKA